MEEAERIARDEHGSNKISVISGITDMIVKLFTACGIHTFHLQSYTCIEVRVCMSVVSLVPSSPSTCLGMRLVHSLAWKMSLKDAFTTAHSIDMFLYVISQITVRGDWFIPVTFLQVLEHVTTTARLDMNWMAPICQRHLYDDFIS